jgi:NAD(P)-dependent dehydrogenase (short-subunit alcohol dehydrogenase family)
MKIIVIGAAGTIGQKIVAAIEDGHEIIKVGRKSGDLHADITDPGSLKELFEKAGKFDALVNASGDVAYSPFRELDDSHFDVGYKSKFLGQVHLVTLGKDQINDGGSITLTSGILSHEFVPFGSAGSAMNSAIETFAQAAACEIGRGIRINVVCPGLLEESAKAYGSYFPGHIPVSGSKVAQFYKRSIFGVETGKVFLAIR